MVNPKRISAAHQTVKNVNLVEEIEKSATASGNLIGLDFICSHIIRFALKIMDLCSQKHKIQNKSKSFPAFIMTLFIFRKAYCSSRTGCRRSDRNIMNFNAVEHYTASHFECGREEKTSEKRE